MDGIYVNPRHVERILGVPLRDATPPDYSLSVKGKIFLRYFTNRIPGSVHIAKG